MIRLAILVLMAVMGGWMLHKYTTDHNIIDLITGISCICIALINTTVIAITEKNGWL